MPTWLTATRAQPGGGAPAAGRSSRASSPGDRQTMAFMIYGSRSCFLLASPPSQPVEIDDDDDEQAGDDALPERVDVQEIGAVVDGGEDEGAEQRPMHRADGAEQRGAADHR